MNRSRWLHLAVWLSVGAVVACGSDATDAGSTGSGAASAGGGTNTGGQGAGGEASGGGSSSGGGGAAGGSGPMGTFESYNTLAVSYIDAPPAGANPFGHSFARDVAFDSQGNMVIVGGTETSTFPTTAGAYDTVYGGPGMGSVGSFGTMDVFVAKIDPDGNMLWGTFLGGPSYDRAYAVEVGPNDDVFVAGRAGMGFPTTSGVVQETFAGDNQVNNGYGPQDGFIARLSADGSQLLWSTYFGATGRGFIRDLDVDAQGDVYVALSDVGGNFSYLPVEPGPRNSVSGTRDAYYGKVSSDGSTLLFGTYIGGPDGGSDDGKNPSIRVIPSGDVFVVTFTTSANVDIITNNAYQQTHAGAFDMVLARFDSNNALVYCTYYGGSGNEGMETHGLAVDAQGNAYIAGGTGSDDLPMTAAAAQPNRLHNGDGFIALFSADGASLLAATYVGMPSRVGSINSMNLEGLALTPSGDLVAGGSDRPNNSSIRHAIMARVSGDLSTLREVVTFGGSARDELRSVAVAPNGTVVYGGHSTSDDLMTVNAFDPTYSCNPNNAASYVMLQPLFSP